MLDVLHLFGNWKWTGPTELAVHLAEMQAKAGHRVRFAFGRTRGADEHFPRQIAARGIPRAEGFELAKHFEPTSVFRDALRLARLVREDPPDLIHCHLPSDHLVAALARPLAKRRVPVVRSTYLPDGPGEGLRESWCLRTATDALILPCEGARERMPRARGFDAARASVIEPAIDTDRFDPDRDAGDGRARLGIARDAFVLGIVARVQRKR
ncbi:MAG TPA: glycosyltransferase, partial [Planctomycetota bacterium]|nr:glycosyltransferase [Planctomycetota bacterium]